jgi:hypothetical protein
VAQAELLVPYDPEQRRLYEQGDTRSIYRGEYPRHLWRGIYRRGRFPEIAVKAALKRLGFSVLISHPRMPGNGGFILTHYAAKRRKEDLAFKRMFNWFPPDLLARQNRECDMLKRGISENRGGGDPDLFVFSESGDRFFVEVKDQDELIPKQHVVFPRISEILRCDVLIARVVAKAGAKPGDGLQLVSRPVKEPLQLTSRSRVTRVARRKL